MKQVKFISRFGRVFPGYVPKDMSSMTEQNLRLSQAEKAIDMANGRIPVIPPAVLAKVPDSSDVLPEQLQDMLGAYHSPYIDPATKSVLYERLRFAYADYISTREAAVKEAELASAAEKEVQYKALLDKMRSDLGPMLGSLK